MTEKPAWRVEMYWFSSVSRGAGWIRPTDPDQDKTFRTERAARLYAERMTGCPSIFVPFMTRKGIIVPTTRRGDWLDWLAALILKARTAAEADAVGEARRDGR